MIYIDTSVVLAHLLAEDRSPPDDLWSESLVSSRLLEYEATNRINAERLGRSHGDLLRDLLTRIAFLEMLPRVLVRALEPFPVPVRTLDAIHLASADFLRQQGQQILLATYDERMRKLADRMGFELVAM
jgi:predicted nucleic acid-binding protein